MTNEPESFDNEYINFHSSTPNSFINDGTILVYAELMSEEKWRREQVKDDNGKGPLEPDRVFFQTKAIPRWMPKWFWRLGRRLFPELMWRLVWGRDEPKIENDVILWETEEDTAQNDAPAGDSEA